MRPSLIVFTGLALCHAAEPRFDRYPVARVYSGPVALPRFSSDTSLFPEWDFRCAPPEARERRWIYATAKVNFAGEWVIEKCSCGTGCAAPFMYHARTGAIRRRFPIATVNVGDPRDGWPGLQYRPDSRLLIIDGILRRTDREYRAREEYLWTGTGFVLLRRHAGPKQPPR